mmetsp:Transcript_15936/g.41204  ORF Transcript_15936/g.41204 Transcript_15936/m.41204 type:complete len:352 (+) Transcript_15936:463-1518(+)
MAGLGMDVGRQRDHRVLRVGGERGGQPRAREQLRRGLGGGDEPARDDKVADLLHVGGRRVLQTRRHLHHHDLHHDEHHEHDVRHRDDVDDDDDLDDEHFDVDFHHQYVDRQQHDEDHNDGLQHHDDDDTQHHNGLEHYDKLHVILYHNLLYHHVDHDLHLDHHHDDHHVTLHRGLRGPPDDTRHRHPRHLRGVCHEHGPAGAAEEHRQRAPRSGPIDGEHPFGPAEPPTRRREEAAVAGQRLRRLHDHHPGQEGGQCRPDRGALRGRLRDLPAQPPGGGAAGEHERRDPLGVANGARRDRVLERPGPVHIDHHDDHEHDGHHHDVLHELDPARDLGEAAPVPAGPDGGGVV